MDPTKTHDDQEPRTCRSATSQSQHAHAEAPPACTRLAGTPLLGKVRALKASAKNAGLIPLTPPHGRSNLKVEPQTKTTATWRASAKQSALPEVLQANTPENELRTERNPVLRGEHDPNKNGGQHETHDSTMRECCKPRGNMPTQKPPACTRRAGTHCSSRSTQC